MADRVINSSCNAAAAKPRWGAIYDTIVATTEINRQQQPKSNNKPMPKTTVEEANTLIGNSSPKLNGTVNFMLQSGSSGVHSWHSARLDEQTTLPQASPTPTLARPIVISKQAAALAFNQVPKQQPNLNCTSNNNNITGVKIYRTPTLEQLTNLHIHAKMKPRNKNEDAISDLLQRIPEVGRNFNVHSRIGNGTFSTVLLATLKREAELPENMRRKFAIKHHIPTSHPDRIMKELQCMTKMGGTNNVVGINCCLRSNASAAFVMPYMAHDRFHDFYTKMDIAEIRLYMRNLLVALRHVHKFNIIHRDVKPSNFLYNRRRSEFLLVDFGLAQHVNAPMAQPQQPMQEQRRCAGGGVGAAGTNKRPRERVGHETAASNAQQPLATGDVGAKRIRLQDESAAAGGSWNKMPLKPVNEIALSTTKGAEALGDVGEQSQSQSTAAAAGELPCEQPPTAPTSNNSNSNNNNSKYNTNRNAAGDKCFCFCTPTVCLTCLMKKEVHASRAGTPGYRPPEVLLKYTDQTTAVDVWAAGVIFLSILSSVYPFFKAPNDYIALAEIVTIFGDRAIRKTAVALDRMVTLSQRSRPLSLRKLCLRFRHRTIFSDPQLVKKHESADGHCDVCKNCDQYYFNCLCEDCEYVTEPLDPYECFPPSAYDLLQRLLEVNPHKRITAEQALEHPFFSGAQLEASTPPLQRSPAKHSPTTRRRIANKAAPLAHPATCATANAAAVAAQQYAISFTQAHTSLNKL